MLHRLTATIGLLALSTGLALAQTGTPTAPAAGGVATVPANSADSNLKEWQLAKVAKVSLLQAIDTAQKQGDEKDGRAIDADFEKAGGKDPVHYSVKVVYPSGKLVEYGINADTNTLYKTENQPIERYFTRLKPADFHNAKISLKEALAVAEQKAGGGKAYEASVSKDGSAVQYAIKVAGADKEQTVTVGPDGKVVD